MKRFFSMVVFLICIGSLLFAGGGKETTVGEAIAPEDITIFVESFMKGVPVNNQWEYGPKKAAEELGIKVVCDASNDGTLEKNLALIEQAIGQGFTGIACISVSDDAYTPVIEKAFERGIPVATYHMDAPSSKRIAYFGPNQESYARYSARVIADALNKEGKVITIQGPPSDMESFILDSFADELSKYAPDMEIVAELSDTLDVAKAYEKITAAIQANPDTKGFFSCTSRGGSDVATILEEQGIGFEGIQNITMDPVPSNLKLLEQGKITGLVDQGALFTGYRAVKALYEYITTGKVVSWAPGINYIEDIIVTKDMLDEYKQMNEDAGL
jgi:ribose transport system substrate-binding protein